MSDSERPGHQLLGELHDFERRYDMAKGRLSADEVFALWSALWRFSRERDRRPSPTESRRTQAPAAALIAEGDR